jgi:hypothetical protein
MAMQTNAGDFKEILVKSLDVELDALNPRIDVSPTASQVEIRVALLQTEDVRELAEGIVKNGGMLPGERIIVLKEGGRHVVLEGNRRLCACQMLLDRSLIAPGHKAKFPELGAELRNRIERLQADLSPTREAAEYVITKRHTDPGIKRWSVVAKQRRIARFISEDHTLEQAANYYNEDLYDLKRTMQGFNLLATVRKLPVWTPTERKQLIDPELVVNPFIRFFQLGGTRDAFGLKFEETDATLKPENPGTDFERSLENTARIFLLPDSSGKRAANTRATPQDVLPKVLVGQLKARLKPSKPMPGKSARRAKPSARSAVFFETLVCNIQDDRLAQVASELRVIDHRKLPTSAAFLVRALVEATLEWCVRHANLQKAIQTEFKTANPTAKFGPGLEFYLNFVTGNYDKIFSDKEIKRPLSQWLHQHKDGLDMVIHGKWRTNITVNNLETVASMIRPAVQRILDKSALL